MILNVLYSFEEDDKLLFTLCQEATGLLFAQQPKLAFVPVAGTLGFWRGLLARY